MKLLSIDLETGGRHPWSCGITEIGAVAGRVKDGRFEKDDELRRLVRPVEGLLYESTALHLQKRTYGDLMHADYFEYEVGADLLEFIEEFQPGVITTFNLDFDWGFLDALAFRTIKKPFVSLIPEGIERICAQSLSRNAFGAEKEGWTLRRAWMTACGGFEWDPEAAHSAIYDARRAAEVFAASYGREAQDA